MAKKATIMTIKEMVSGKNSGIVRGKVIETDIAKSNDGRDINKIKINDGNYQAWIATWDEKFDVGDLVELQGYTEERNGYWNIKIGLPKWGGYIKKIDNIDIPTTNTKSKLQTIPEKYYKMTYEELEKEYEKPNQEGYIYGMLGHMLQRREEINETKAIKDLLNDFLTDR